jgi:transcriptional regulator with XRE-family HTH domain
MARKNPIPKRELEIASRLREIRQSNHMSMVAMAHVLGINALRYMNYEYGKVPLPYVVGDRLVKHFRISQCWLAERVGPMHYSVYYSPGADIGPRDLFSAVYNRYFQKFRHIYSAVSVGLRGQKPSNDRIKRETLTVMASAFDAADEPQTVELADRTAQMLRLFDAAHPGIVNFEVPPSKTEVDKLPQIEKHPGVPLTLSKVLDRARALTEKRGMRSKLAEDLSVSASRITDWLAGTFEPGGDATLRLLHWVEKHEGKKAAGVASISASGKPTRARNSRETKPKSGQSRSK